MHATHSIVTLTAATLLLGAWRLGPPAVTDVQSGDACALLTTAQVSAALGTTVEAGKSLVPSNTRICGWAPPGGAEIDGKKLTLALMTVKSFEAGKTPYQGIEKTPLSGVGDDAIYVTAGGLGTALNVKKGNSAFQVKVGGFKKDQEKEIEKALALQVLAKM